MVDSATASASARVLLPIAQNVAGKVQRLNAERRAGRAPSDLDTDLMGRILADTFARLHSIEIDDKWWRGILNSLLHEYITPDFYRKPSIQAWLDIPDVRKFLLGLARANIMDRDHENNGQIRGRLAEKYADQTGESTRFAKDPIDVTVAILTAGYLETIPYELRALIGMIQEGNNQIVEVKNEVKKVHERLDQEFTPESSGLEVIIRHTEDKLSAIYALWQLDPVEARKRIFKLYHRVDDGDLSKVPTNVKNRVYYATARIALFDSAKLTEAKVCRQMLPNDYEDGNLRILDALINAAEGREEDALRYLRDEEDAESRSVLFGLMMRFRGAEETIIWFKDVDPGINPSYFDNLGWQKWAVCLGRLDRWEDAADGLKVLASSVADWPLMWAFLEGTINSALLLPPERRNIVLRSLPIYPQIAISFRPDTNTLHSRAVKCFEFVARNLPDGADEIRKDVADWLIWLQLMSPNREVADEGRSELRARLEAGEYGVGIVSMAWAFGIEFEQERSRNNLVKREQIGGLDDNDVVAECLMNQINEMPPGDFVEYLNRRWTELERAMPKPYVVAMLFDALNRDGQFESAKRVIERLDPILDAEIVARMEAELQKNQQDDPTKHLEEEFKRTRRTADLEILVEHLQDVGDRNALVPYMRELFDRETTVRLAHDVAQALNMPPTDHLAIADFLEQNMHIVNQDNQLRFLLAWSLLHVGRVKDARKINYELLERRRDAKDLVLDIRLSVTTGDWERLISIVERERSFGNEHESDTLLLLAGIANLFGRFALATTLARQAVQKGPSDPRVLIGAYQTYVQAGRDDEADPNWLNSAVEHSSESGPAWQINIEEFVNDWLPRRRKFTDDVTDKLIKGEMPIVLAMTIRGDSIANVFFTESRNDPRDGRKRRVLPIIAGVHGPVDVQHDWTMGLDITSIMLFGRLGVLEKVIDALDHVKIAPGVMECLLKEVADVRFHQPMLVQAAKELRKLINLDQIKVIPDTASLTRGILEEANAELADLLRASKIDNGITICSKNITNASSGVDETADSFEIENCIYSPADLCVSAYREGLISAEQIEKATRYQKGHDKVSERRLTSENLERPIYLDSLALTDLQSAQVLEPLAESGLNLRIHRTVYNENNALIHAEERGEQLVNSLEDIKDTLKKGIDSGKITLLPHSPEYPDFIFNMSPSVISFNGLIAGVEDCDAVCIDDRYLNGHPNVSGPTDKRVPVVCVIDMLKYMRCNRLIGDDEYWHALHNLRNDGFEFIPIDHEELLHRLTSASIEDRVIIESVELRTIRQTINHINSIDVVKEDEAHALSQHLFISVVQTLRELWRNTTIDSDTVSAMSDWIWNFLPVVTHLIPVSAFDDTKKIEIEEFVADRICMLTMASTAESVERRLEYRKWLERCVIEPLILANPNLIDRIVYLLLEKIDALNVKEETIFDTLFVGYLPDCLRMRVVDKRLPFRRNFDHLVRPALTIEEGVQIDESELIAKAKILFDGAEKEVLKSHKGTQIDVDLTEEKYVRMSWTRLNNTRGQAVLPELTLISDRQSDRIRVAERLREFFGPTAEEQTTRLINQVVSRKLNDEELSVIFNEKSSGVIGVQSRLIANITAGWRPSLDEQVPSKINYWDRFCGAVPTDQDPDSYFTNELVPYRRALLEANLPRGLDICLLGAIRDDLSPVSWVEGYEDESVLQALSLIPIRGSPIAAIGALDIALSRIENRSFREIAEKSIQLLLDEHLCFLGDYDGYRFFEMVLEFEMNRLSLIENGLTSPGYWRRMCAWMQAGLIVRTTCAQGILPDLDQLENWFVNQMTPIGALLHRLDCRVEPLMLGSLAGRGYLEAEVLRRLEAIKMRYERSGQSVPLNSDIDETITALSQRVQKAQMPFRGPAELHKLPDIPLTPRDVKVLDEMWRSDSPTQSLSVLAFVSQRFILGDRIIDAVLKYLSVPLSDDQSVQDRISQLHASSIMAGTIGSTAIADSIGRMIEDIASNLKTPAEVEMLMHILLQAAAAYRDHSDWRKWIGDRLYRVADALPSNSRCLDLLLAFIEYLATTLPVSSWVHIRAKSLVISGIADAK